MLVDYVQNEDKARTTIIILLCGLFVMKRKKNVIYYVWPNFFRKSLR